MRKLSNEGDIVKRSCYHTNKKFAEKGEDMVTQWDHDSDSHDILWKEKLSLLHIYFSYKGGL